MKHKRIKVSTLLLGLGIASQAQESANAAGGDASGSGGNMSYSIGIPLYTEHTGTSGKLTNGVQQPYEVSIVSGIENDKVSLNLNAYPNPTRSDLTLYMGDTELPFGS